MKTLKLTSALGLALMVGLAACHPNTSTDDNKAKKTDTALDSAQLDKAKLLVQDASRGHAIAESVFKGPDGLVGVVTQGQGSPNKEIVWASPSLEVLFPGPALTRDGNNLTEKAMVEQKITPQQPKAELNAEQLGEALVGKGFIVGTKGPLITAFMDPNCIFCNRFYNDVAPLVKSGQVRVRYIMVGFLKPTSIPRSVAILAAKDPAKALERDEKNFDEAHEEGGEAPATGNHPKQEEEVRANTELMGKAGPISTPTLVLCKTGNAPEIIRGQPQDLKGLIATLDKSSNYGVCK